jgi:hypothetical protein
VPEEYRAGNLHERFLFFGQTFFEQSISIAREIKSKYPDSEFGAIVASRSNLMSELDRLDNPKFSRYDWLSGLEDPESSTMVLAEKHTDQMAVIEAIAKSMPVGMRLVVKEHIATIMRDG